jgi:Protein of unknown function (DUF3352)
MPRPARPSAPWLQSALYAVEDFAYAAGRVPAAIADGAHEFWFSLSSPARVRLGLAVGAVAAIAVAWLAVVPALGCGSPGGEPCPPADDAIRLVPDDALAYVHVNVDPGTEQYEDAVGVAERTPSLSSQAVRLVETQLFGPDVGTPDFTREIEPWFGGEAAVALLPGDSGRGQRVEFLEADDEEGAREFAASLASGEVRSTTYREVPLSVDRGGVATTVDRGFLVIGLPRSVREVIDTRAGEEGAGSLADDSNATAARDALPDKRLADAYLSEDGIAELIAGVRGPLADLAPIVNPDATSGAAAGVVAGDDGFRLAIRSQLDPERAETHPGFFAAFPPFSPSLAGSLPEDTLGYLGIDDPGSVLTALFEQAGAQAPGLAEAVGALIKDVRKLGNVDLEQDLLPSLGGEGALALQPASGEGDGGDEQAAPTTGVPFIEFIADDVDSERAEEALARLQAPILDALSPTGSLEAPAFEQHQVGDVTAHSVRLSGSVDLTYAVAGSTLVVATDRAAVDQVVSGDGGLDEADRFQAATDGLPGEPSMLGYLDLSGLTALGEQAGLAEDPAYATFASDIANLEALGLTVQSSSQELSTDVRLVVGSDGESDSEAPSE